MKKLFFFLALGLISFTNVQAEEPPFQNLNCSVLEFNIVGEDIIVFFDVDGDNNISLAATQQLIFSTSSGNIDVQLNVVSHKIVGEDIIVVFDSPSINLNGLQIQTSQVLQIQ